MAMCVVAKCFKARMKENETTSVLKLEIYETFAVLEIRGRAEALFPEI